MTQMFYINEQRQKLKQIADNRNTQYILDRLEDVDKFFLANSWDGIVKKLRDEYSKTGLDKNILIILNNQCVKKKNERKAIQRYW